MSYPAMAEAIWIDGRICKPGELVEFRQKYYGRYIRSFRHPMGVVAEIDMGNARVGPMRIGLPVETLRKVQK